MAVARPRDTLDNQKHMKLIQMAGAILLLASGAFCQVPGTLVVRGVDGKSVTLSVSDLAKIPQQTVKTTDHTITAAPMSPSATAWSVPLSGQTCRRSTATQTTTARPERLIRVLD